jgi:hypothetical protein
MRPISLVSLRGLLSSAILLSSVSALAQTPAPDSGPAPAPAAPAAGPGADNAPPTPPPTPTPPPSEVAPPPPSEPAPPPAPLASEAPAEEEETWPAAWFRIDSDLAGLQLWAGATHMLSDSVGIATDMYVNSNTLGEFDIGPSFVAGPLYITPMLGLQVDWSQFKAVALVPQLYVTGGPDPIYTELWIQNYEYNVFDDTNGANTLYFRFFIDYKIGKYLGVGPEVEALLGLNDAAKPSGDTLVSLPVGVNVMLSNYGKGNNFFIFAGYETQDTANDAHFAGRLTFVRNF